MTVSQSVLMLVTNSVEQDSRVKKTARALIGLGWEVQIYGMSHDVAAPTKTIVDGLAVTLFNPNPEKKPRCTGLFRGFRSRFGFLNHFLAPQMRISRGFESQILKYRGVLKAIPKLPYLLLSRFREPRMRMSRGFERQILKFHGVPQVDVVHCNDFDTLRLGLRLAKRCGALTIYDSHEYWAGRNVNGKNSLRYRVVRLLQKRQEGRMMGKCSSVVTVSHGIAELLSAQSKKPVTVIRNIPEVGNRTTKLDHQDFQQNTIFYSGRITTGRAIYELIEAVGDPSLRAYGICLLGYGSPVYLEEVKDFALRMEVTLEIIDPVPSDQVSSRLAIAEVVFVGVQPIVESYRLALPNKLFEALHSGRPIVVPNLPEIERTVRGLEAVYSCDPMDPASITEAILAASAKDADSVRLRAERQELFSWETERQKWKEVYPVISR